MPRCKNCNRENFGLLEVCPACIQEAKITQKRKTTRSDVPVPQSKLDKLNKEEFFSGIGICSKCGVTPKAKWSNSWCKKCYAAWKKEWRNRDKDNNRV